MNVNTKNGLYRYNTVIATMLLHVARTWLDEDTCARIGCTAIRVRSCVK
jgi:hypothetical protein